MRKQEVQEEIDGGNGGGGSGDVDSGAVQFITWFRINANTRTQWDPDPDPDLAGLANPESRIKMASTFFCSFKDTRDMN
jgi:hypothetical protein